jgi:aconitate hydratase
VVLQDFTGVPCVVDLAAMRDAVVKLGGSPEQINPIPSELVIDHSVQVDVFGKPDALDLNGKIEFQRNQERYGFLRWGQKAFDNFKVVPPNTGIVHQVNLENLARVVMTADKDGKAWWPTRTPCSAPTAHHHDQRHRRAGLGRGRHRGRGGHARPAVVDADPAGGRLQADRQAARGATATDLVLTVTQMLRKLGVVGKFVEFYGDGLQHLPLADRATIGNMARNTAPPAASSRSTPSR